MCEQVCNQVFLAFQVHFHECTFDDNICFEHHQFVVCRPKSIDFSLIVLQSSFIVSAFIIHLRPLVLEFLYVFGNLQGVLPKCTKQKLFYSKTCWNTLYLSSYERRDVNWMLAAVLEAKLQLWEKEKSRQMRDRFRIRMTSSYANATLKFLLYAIVWDICTKNRVKQESHYRFPGGGGICAHAKTKLFWWLEQKSDGKNEEEGPPHMLICLV